MISGIEVIGGDKYELLVDLVDWRGATFLEAGSIVTVLSVMRDGDKSSVISKVDDRQVGVELHSFLACFRESI